MVLDWLKSLGQKPDHPMHSVEEAKRLLADLPVDSYKALQEVTSWLTTVTSATGFRPATRIAIVKLIDETAQPIERDVMESLTSSELKHFTRIQVWKSVLEFWDASSNAHCFCFDELRRDPKRLGMEQKDLALLFVRALRALATKDKTLHLRYEPASEDALRPAYIVCKLQSATNRSEEMWRQVPIRANVWRAIFDLYRLSETFQCDSYPVRPYARESSSTSKQELLRALMLQVASPEAMLPRQVEFAAIVTARFAASCLFASEAGPDCNWSCDLAQLDAADRGTEREAGSMMRYFGAGVALSKIGPLIDQLTSAPAKMEDKFDEHYSPQEQLVVLKHLQSHWGSPPPLRREPRPPGTADIVVAHGFKAACELVPSIASASAAAEAGAILGLDVAADSADIPFDRWMERDSGAWGLGVAVPRKSEPWIIVGALCTLRVADSPWYVAVVRRLYRDSSKQQFAGLQILAKKPSFVRLRHVSGGPVSGDKWDPVSDSSHSLVRAILLEDSANAALRRELLVPRGDCTPAAVYEVPMADGTRRVRLEETLEQGEDFDHARYTWI